MGPLGRGSCLRVQTSAAKALIGFGSTVVVVFKSQQLSNFIYQNHLRELIKNADSQPLIPEILIPLGLEGA